MKKRNPYLTVGLVMTGILTALIVLGFFWTPYDPNAMAAGPKLTGTERHHGEKRGGLPGGKRRVHLPDPD